jgi:hypothetical protein
MISGRQIANNVCVHRGLLTRISFFKRSHTHRDKQYLKSVHSATDYSITKERFTGKSGKGFLHKDHAGAESPSYGRVFSGKL